MGLAQHSHFPSNLPLPFGHLVFMVQRQLLNHPAGEGGRNGTAIQQSLFDNIITPVMYVMHEDF